MILYSLQICKYATTKQIPYHVQTPTQRSFIMEERNACWVRACTMCSIKILTSYQSLHIEVNAMQTPTQCKIHCHQLRYISAWWQFFKLLFSTTFQQISITLKIYNCETICVPGASHNRSLLERKFSRKERIL